MSRILIVDDSPALLEFFEVLLKLRHYETETATTRSELLSKLNSFTPDLILLDVKLNGHDGREICREINTQKVAGGFHIILLSADPTLLEGYKACGADEVIDKPFQIQTVINKIEKLLKHFP